MVRIVRIEGLNIIVQSQQLSPEVLKAQKIAELEQLAKYRARKIEKYKEWSNPEKRQAIKKTYEKDLQVAKERWDEAVKNNPDLISSLIYHPKKDISPFIIKPSLKLPKIEYLKAKTKLSLWQRFKKWISTVQFLKR